MDPIDINGPKALELLEQAVAQRTPGHVYKFHPKDKSRPQSNCVYVYKGQPDCIVGLALHLGGWPIEELATLDQLSDSALGNPEVRDFLNRRGVTVAAVEILRSAQRCQDLGNSWGTALAAARDCARDRLATGGA